ncbi:unnamed protein product [Calypogeia fissa]
MLGVARFFWRRYVKQARQLLDSIRESDTKRYYREFEIVNRLEALFLFYSLKGDLEDRWLDVLRPEYVAGLFFDKEGNLLSVVEALEVLTTDFYDLSGCGYLSKFVIREVVVRGMDHIPVIEQEKAVQEGRVIRDEAGTSNPPPGSAQDKPNSPRSPRHVEHERVATPPQEPAGAELVDDPIGDTIEGFTQ